MAEPLIVPSALRPWLKAGLSFLLLDSEERANTLRAVSGREGTAPPRHPDAGRESGRTAEPSGASAPSPDHATGKQGRSRPDISGGTPQIQDKASFSPATASRPAASTDNGRILPPDAWPPAWQALKNRRPLPPRPLVFWTYGGLGDELMGTPDAARQQVIVRMLTALRHPGGTHVFWPYALPDDDTTGDNTPSLFWSGVALLRPRAILLFGSEARDALNMPKSLVPFCQERLNGRLVIQLPQPASLVSPDGNDDAFRRALAFLSRLLNFCASR